MGRSRLARDARVSAVAVVVASGLLLSAQTGISAAEQGHAANRASTAAHAICRARSPRPSLAAAQRHAAPAAVIRVDQVGYPTAGPTLAEIMTAPRFRGDVRWVLVRSGSCTIAAPGRVSAQLGSWNKRYPHVWLVSFACVRTLGW